MVKDIKAIFKKRAYSKAHKKEVVYFYKFFSYNLNRQFSYGLMKDNSLYESTGLGIAVYSLMALFIFFPIIFILGPYVGILLSFILIFFTAYLLAGLMIYIPLFRTWFIDKFCKLWKDTLTYKLLSYKRRKQ